VIYDPVRDECFTARRGGGAWLDGRPIRCPAVVDPAEALTGVSFPPHVAPQSEAVADFLAVLPHVHSVRRTGSTALNLAYLACGRLHAFWARRIACWDVAAGLLIAREAGAAIETFTTESATIPLDDPAFLAASTPQLLTAVRGLVGGGVAGRSCGS
jgi:myo-inositol-1(or 4)-monophosphatase